SSDLPGFVRGGKPGDGGTTLNTTLAPASDAQADEDGFDAAMEPEVNCPGDPLTEDEVRAVLTRRVRDAEQALSDARRQVSEAQQHMFNMEKRLTRAMT